MTSDTRFRRALSAVFSFIFIAISINCLSVAVADAAGDPPVKLSSSGICHDASSPSYAATRNFTPYPSLQKCLDAGGRLPKNAGSATGKTAAGDAPSGAEYRRDDFGKSWEDLDHDCQNSRQEALISQSTVPVTFKSDHKCTVATGRWVSPYSGAVIQDPRKIDIDHIVPLKWAWEHGASRWTLAQREKFANDPVNLVSVEASLNRQKGALGPDQWLPPSEPCGYVSRFVRIQRLYKLDLSAGEQADFSQVMTKVCRGRN